MLARTRGIDRKTVNKLCIDFIECYCILSNSYAKKSVRVSKADVGKLMQISRGAILLVKINTTGTSYLYLSRL